MSFKIGLVGLCTSHPECWVPIIQKFKEENRFDVEVIAAWDSGETRPEGFAFTKEFCEKFNIPNALENLDDMIDMVDGVIVHTTNWDKHLEQAQPFVDAGKSVLLDKPVVGNVADANQVIDWIKSGKRITGGSSLRFTEEVKEFLAQPVEERGTPHTAYLAIGVDDMNYGIHAYSMASSIFGAGISSVKYLGQNVQKHIQITWKNGCIAFLTIGKTAWLPFNATIVTDKNVFQIGVLGSRIYKSLLENELPYFCGLTDEPPLTTEEFLEPELAAIAARTSWMNNGQEIFLTDLRHDAPGYDGTQFAREYRQARLEG